VPKMMSEMDRAIEVAAVCLEFDVRHTGHLTPVDISRILHKSIDPIRILPGVKLPVTNVVTINRGDSIKLPFMEDGWIEEQVALSFINRLAIKEK
jgi:hypothetical protein